MTDKLLTVAQIDALLTRGTDSYGTPLPLEVRDDETLEAVLRMARVGARIAAPIHHVRLHPPTLHVAQAVPGMSVDACTGPTLFAAVEALIEKEKANG